MRKLLYALLFVCMNVSATNYYVKNGGNDEADGLSDETAWATLAKVTAFQTSQQPGDSILFKRGDTFYGNITGTLSGGAKPGTVDNRIVYGAYGTGEKPVFTSFVTLTEWTDEGGGIYSKAVECASSPNYIVINDEWYAMGRYPNEGLLTYESFATNVSITDNELTGDPNWTGAEAVVRKNSWTWDRCAITAHTDQTLTYSNLGSTSNGTAGYGYFIQNDIRTLDVLGEWYYDMVNKVMYVYFGAENPDNHTVKVPTIDNLIYNYRISYITYENIQFTGTLRSLIFLISFADHIHIRNCDFEFAGEHGMRLEVTRNIIVDNNTVSNTVKCGIFMDSTREPTFTNNVITNTGTLLGAWLGSSVQITGLAVLAVNEWSTGTWAEISNNVIDGCGYHGIRFTGKDMTVKNNVIKNSVLTLNDGAAMHSVLSAGGDKGAVPLTNRLIEENIIINAVGNISGTTAAPAADGIYLNNVLDGNILYNTIAHCRGNAFRLGNVREYTLEGNVVYDNTNAVIYLTSTTTGNNMNMNVFVAKSAEQTTLRVGIPFSDTEKFVSAYGNYYARPVDDNAHMMFFESDAWVSKTLEDWQTQSGEDADAFGSPIDITEESMLRFYYNATDEDADVTPDKRMIDMDGNEVAEVITLDPWRSVVLLVDPTYVGIRKDAKSEKGFIAYPNPATSLLMIRVAETNQDRVNFTIMDIQGRVVIKGQLDGMSNEAYPINVSNLSSGMYLIRVEGMDGKAYNERVIIRR